MTHAAKKLMPSVIRALVDRPLQAESLVTSLFRTRTPPAPCVYSRFFSQEQAVIAEMRMAAYLMLEGLGMIRGWLRNLHAAL